MSALGSMPEQKSLQIVYFTSARGTQDDAIVSAPLNRMHIVAVGGLIARSCQRASGYTDARGDLICSEGLLMAYSMRGGEIPVD